MHTYMSFTYFIYDYIHTYIHTWHRDIERYGYKKCENACFHIYTARGIVPPANTIAEVTTCTPTTTGTRGRGEWGQRTGQVNSMVAYLIRYWMCFGLRSPTNNF